MLLSVFPPPKIFASVSFLYEQLITPSATDTPRLCYFLVGWLVGWLFLCGRVFVFVIYVSCHNHRVL